MEIIFANSGSPVEFSGTFYKYFSVKDLIIDIKELLNEKKLTHFVSVQSKQQTK
jgi:hypothetical protein